MDEELDHFKINIRLHEYAARCGYEVDKEESSPREVVMRRAADKISIRRDTDNHYIYYSFRDPEDNGTIIDFVRKRETGNLGAIRKKLRPWLGRSIQTSLLPVFEDLSPAPRANRAHVAAEYAKTKPLQWHDYLQKHRSIPASVLLSPRFDGCLRIDARGNAVFPHYDNNVLCGFEKRNRFFKGFADLGEKGLWLSVQMPADTRLVVAESSIDCLSYHAIYPDGQTRYASIAGGLNPAQPALLLAQCSALPPGSEVVCITHPDKEGDVYAAVLEKTVADTRRSDLRFRIHRPVDVKDWNDELRSR